MDTGWTTEEVDTREWLRLFLDARKLEKPDGRPLYGYRTTRQEFDSLARCLTRERARRGHAMRGFALYASEWWMRHYQGNWAWAPLLDSLAWRGPYHDYYDSLREAWRWWGHRPERYESSSTTYLGTIACQGGLPLAMTSKGSSSVALYLKGVIRQVARYGALVDDPAELATDPMIFGLLKPKVMQKPYVARLATTLAEAVLELRPHLEGEDEPIPTLDAAKPDWRDGLPISLSDANSERLLVALLRETRRTVTTEAEAFGIRRQLLRRMDGWRLAAEAEIPPAVDASALAKAVGVGEDDLPLRLSLRMDGDEPKALGRLAFRSDTRRYVRTTSAQSLSPVHDEAATRDLSISLHAADRVGHPIEPVSGTRLEALPWVFAGDPERGHELIATGSVRTRMAKVLVALRPDDEPVQDGEGSLTRCGHVLDREVFELEGSFRVATDVGVVRIRTRVPEEAARAFGLTGQRYQQADCRHPVFTSQPTLVRSEADGRPKRLAPHLVEWRHADGSWRNHPTGHGLFDVRFVEESEVRFHSRVGRVPADFSLRCEGSEEFGEGTLHITADPLPLCAVIAVQGLDDVAWDFDVEDGGGERVISVRIDDPPERPPSCMTLELAWPGGAPLRFDVPFPARHAEFTRSGKRMGAKASMDLLVGARASAHSFDPLERFDLCAELHARDIDAELRSRSRFEKPLKPTGLSHELALIDVRDALNAMLSTSSDLDARVRLALLDGFGRPWDQVDIHRFADEIHLDPSMPSVQLAGGLRDDVQCFHLLDLSRPERPPVELQPLDPAAPGAGAHLPQDVVADRPWLAAAVTSSLSMIRPALLQNGATPEGLDFEPSASLASAVRLTDRRARDGALRTVMARMVETDALAFEEDWVFLAALLELTETHPASTFDVLSRLVVEPQLLVRALLRLEEGPRTRLLELEDQLPFSWLLVPRIAWVTQIDARHAELTRELASLGYPDSMAVEAIDGVLRTVTDRQPGMDSLRRYLLSRLKGRDLEEGWRLVMGAARATLWQEQVNLHAALDDWPPGYGKDRWLQELSNADWIHHFGIWKRGEHDGKREPLRFTPDAAAWTAFFGNSDATTAFLVTTLRGFSPDWFDAAYAETWARIEKAVADRTGRSQN